MCLTVAKAIKCLSIVKAIQCQARCQAVALWKWYEGRIRHYNKVRSLTTVHLINSGALCLILLPTCQSTSLPISESTRLLAIQSTVTYSTLQSARTVQSAQYKHVSTCRTSIQYGQYGTVGTIPYSEHVRRTNH